VDVRDLTDWARRVQDPGSVLDDVEVPDCSVRGELLPGWFDDWVLLERERLRQLRMHALELVAERLSDAGRHGDALQAAYAAVHAEPLRESAHRHLITAHLAAGNRAEAVLAYRRLSDLLDSELGIGPSPETAHLLAATVATPPAKEKRSSVDRRLQHTARRSPLDRPASHAALVAHHLADKWPVS